MSHPPARPTRLLPGLTLTKWLLLAGVVAGLAGSASALFLFALDWATRTREATPWLIAFLPLVGAAVGWVYQHHGRGVDAGNNLLIDQIHDPQQTVPLRMAPLVLVSTVLSHLFGASVGREGTAVQMGGALADQISHAFKFGPDDRRVVLMAGIAAGFASVFGTPLAGAVFALEVLVRGRLRLDALLPCVVAAIVADQVGLLWSVHHTHYAVGAVPPLTVVALLAVGVAGVAFGLTGKLFVQASHALSAAFKRWVPQPPLRPFIGGVVVALAVCALGSQRYIGLGIPVIQQAFTEPLAPWDWAAKLAFTVASLGAGFKGGEVTPLFFIGATLGNALAPLLQLPFALLAGVG
ncbi:MAG: hypothetical protein RJA98_855, partial [Pseudomonadota bacterium]